VPPPGAELLSDRESVPSHIHNSVHKVLRLIYYLSLGKRWAVLEKGVTNTGYLMIQSRNFTDKGCTINSQTTVKFQEVPTNARGCLITYKTQFTVKQVGNTSVCSGSVSEL
jgi:hypothetical protein